MISFRSLSLSLATFFFILLKSKHKIIQKHKWGKTQLYWLRLNNMGRVFVVQWNFVEGRCVLRERYIWAARKDNEIRNETKRKEWRKPFWQWHLLSSLTILTRNTIWIDTLPISFNIKMKRAETKWDENERRPELSERTSYNWVNKKCDLSSNGWCLFYSPVLVIAFHLTHSFELAVFALLYASSNRYHTDIERTDTHAHTFYADNTLIICMYVQVHSF